MSTTKTAALLTIALFAPAARATADAPPGRYTISNGTVRDNATRLTWQQTIDSTLRTQSASFAYCSGLTLDGGGWRLPYVSELLTLIDRTRSQPAIDATAFPDTPVTWFWTATPYQLAAGKAWRVDFGIGYSNSFDVVTVARLRCVR